MELAEGIPIGVFTLTTIGFMWKMSNDVNEIKKQVTNDIKHITEEEDGKRARIYERLDENKKFNETTFVRRETCHILHMQNSETLSRIEGKLEVLIEGKHD